MTRASPVPPITTGERTSSAATAAPRPANLHRRDVRKIALGSIEIEARLDLHGLTQSIAHDRLLSFLRRSVAQGHKTVLVITGKGSTPANGSRRSGEEAAGILRRSVPRWLAEPSFARLVVGCHPAATRHGGDGALYLTLRRRAAVTRGRADD